MTGHIVSVMLTLLILWITFHALDALTVGPRRWIAYRLARARQSSALRRSAAARAAARTPRVKVTHKCGCVHESVRPCPEHMPRHLAVVDQVTLAAREHEFGDHA